MNLGKVKFYITFGGLLLSISSCNTSVRGGQLPSEITKEVEGVYVFTYNSGQVEVLKVNLDSSYSKVVYLNDSSFNTKKDTLFYNEGMWRLEGRDIVFKNWLWCNDDSNKNTLLNKPYVVSTGGVSWHESDGSKPASLLVFDEPYYEFKKVPAPNPNSK
jgi:hypothetical protein